MNCDAKEFAQMYKDVYRDLYKFALCLMKNTHDAEDAVSEAVLSAFKNIQQLKEANAFKQWIFTITANVCRKKLKEKIKEREVYVQEECHQEDYGVAIDVQNAFFILTEEEQEIIGLSVFGGYNSKEIGQMLSINPNTIRSKRSRALEKMERVLK